MLYPGPDSQENVQFGANFHYLINSTLTYQTAAIADRWGREKKIRNAWLKIYFLKLIHKVPGRNYKSNIIFLAFIYNFIFKSARIIKVQSLEGKL